jgi:hypothetical protein
MLTQRDAPLCGRVSTILHSAHGLIEPGIAWEEKQNNTKQETKLKKEH